ncbi:MAG: hypothetical protein WC867_08050 [Candidatus Pacearchaeota archaeon]|jgi:hypothetical protein
MVEIPIINVNIPNPENLVWGENYSRKKDKNKLYKILAYIAIIAALIIFFRFAFLAYLYISNIPKINSYDANIENIALTEDGKQAYIKLSGGNQKEIDSIKFIFKSDDNEYIYETKEGISEISYENINSFLSYFANPEYEGSYDYVINASNIGLDNFKEIIKVEVSIKFKDETTGELKETKTMDSSKKEDIKIVRNSGYSGGGGSSGGGSSGSSESNPSCTPNCQGKTCGTDGCSGSCGTCNDNNECTEDSCNIGSCSFNKKNDNSICSNGICKNGICISCSIDSECNDNLACTNDICSTGKCLNNPNNNLCSDGKICSPINGCISIIVPQNLIEIFNRVGRLKDKSANFGIGNNTIEVSLYEEISKNYLWQPETLMYTDVETGHEVWRMTNSPNGYSLYFTDIGINAWSADGKYLTLETIGRPSASRNNFDSWYKYYTGQMVVKTNGDGFRFLTNSSNRNNHWAFVWSPQIPDTFYDFGNPWYWNDQVRTSNILFKNIVTENGCYYIPIFNGNTSLSIGKLISADGRKILALGGNRTKEYFSWFYPITIYPDNKANFDLDKNKYPYQGYSVWRNLPNYAGTDNLNKSSYLDHYYANRAPVAGHDRYYGGDGSWLYWMVPTNGLSNSAWWRLKVLGSASDGGAYSNNLDFPVSDKNYNFGEAWPENHGSFRWSFKLSNISGTFTSEYLNYSVSGSKNRMIEFNSTSNEMVVSFYYTYSHQFKAPILGESVKGLTSGASGTISEIIYGFYPSPFVADTTDYFPDKTCYWSHFVPDRWGRIALFSLSCDFPPGSYYPNGTWKGHNYGPSTWDISKHEYITPTFGNGASHHDWKGFSDWIVSSSGKNKILAAIYNDNNSQIIVTNPYNRLFNGTNYGSITRPTESPDGTKVGFHSEYLNGKADRTDIYWAVVTYPYPPTDLSATINNGLKINFLPPKYTQRGWPFANDSKNKERNGSWPEIDSNGNEIGEPLYAREIKQYHIWKSESQNGPWNEIGNINYLQNYTYHPNEDPNNEMFMLHPIDSTGRKITPTNKLFFTDNLNDGTYYYAITSEEHSGLESNQLSEILKIVISGGTISSQSIVQSKGQKNFWKTAPSSPLNFSYNTLGLSGYYNLSWIEPNDSKIRYYNIYYSNESNPIADQNYRIASLTKSWNHFIDNAADINKVGYYGITSVDRYGNEGNIIYKI